MENLELTLEEKMELEKRGFFVKEYINFLEILRTIPLVIFLSTSITALGLFNTFLLYSLILLFGLSISITFLLFIISGKAFYFKKKIYIHGTIIKKLQESIIARFVTFFSKKYKEQLSIDGLKLDILGFVFLMIYSPILYNAFIGGYYFFISIPFIFLGCIFLLHYIIEHFHPLYAFGNLGERIQKLTPRIEEQSKQIQSEFKSDMNFSVLSNGFDSLSTTFSEIISLVIKLERVETRANKGNLFDSEKYINSLRSDVIIPLNSLRTFLDNQKQELLKSQQELSRVRVGGQDSEINSKGGEHTNLASKRSESLIIELTENIEKLDVMIGKMR